MNTEIFTDLKETFELATGVTALINELAKLKKTNKKQEEDSAQIGSSGDSAQIGSSGYYAKIGSSGDSAQIGSSGYYAKIGSSGYYAKIGSSGDSAQIGSSGYYAKIGSSGDSAKIGSSGYYAKIGSSGDSAKIGSSGYYAKIGSSGDSAQIGSSGDYAKIGSSGDYAQIGSSGDSAQIESTGPLSVVSAIGMCSIVKAKIGSWITLAEYDNAGKVTFVKTEKVDGERIKEDVFYTLYNQKFQEVEEIDGVRTIILSKHKNVWKTKILNSDREGFIFTKDGVTAHGNTVKQAYRDWLFKMSPRDMSEYEGLKLNDVKDINYWAICYRTITGACSAGTGNFIETFKDKLKPEMSLQEVIEVTKGHYGAQTFEEFFKGLGGK